MPVCCLFPNVLGYVAQFESYTVAVTGQAAQVTQSVFGWIAFLLRNTGSGDGDWALNWGNYTNGFSYSTSNMWLGLERIHQLTATGYWKLRLEYYQNTMNQWVSAKYTTFIIGASSAYYVASVQG